MDKLAEYEGFSAVAETGGFTAAAARLGVTASAVSKQVRSLEERLGVRLLHRTTRRVALTDEGRAFHGRLRGILADLSEAEGEMTERQTELRGRLRVGAPMDFGRAHLAAPLAAFAAAHPDLDLEVEFADRFVDIVEEGFDVVVRIGRLADSSLVARRLAPCRRVLCAAPAYLERRGLPRSPRELAGHTRIGYAYEVDRAWTFRQRREAERVALPIRHRTNNGHVTRALLLAGLGIALMPTFLIADDLRTGRLRSVLVDLLDADTAIHAVYPHRKGLSAKVRGLVDFLTRHCGPVPYWDEGLPLKTKRQPSPPEP